MNHKLLGIASVILASAPAVQATALPTPPVKIETQLQHDDLGRPVAPFAKHEVLKESLASVCTLPSASAHNSLCN
ncbi:hypothetical protein ACEN2T_11015 [Pseudomonas sp. W22_MBD1_FP4]|uniref:hypothetical protein n=1 Tax=Pseudomonas TaxID=286 RepID=UPI0034D71F96